MTEGGCNTQLTCLLGDIFDGLREGLRKTTSPDEYERMKQGFIFHMTDWQGDLEKLHELLSDPERWNNETASDFVVGFLYHVTSHVNSARDLLLGDDD